MSLLDDIKTKADANGDGKLNSEDLESLRSGNNGQLIDKLKAAADQNDDGKLSFEDVKNFDFGSTITNIKAMFSGK